MAVLLIWVVNYLSLVFRVLADMSSNVDKLYSLLCGCGIPTSKELLVKG
jgi:hypothetical protein